MPTPNASFEKAQRIARLLALLVGFAMAVASLVNSMPTIWFIRSVGPFQAEYLRGIVLFATVLMVVFTRGFSYLAMEKRPEWLPLGIAADLLMIAGTAYVSYQFVVVNLQIQDALFFFAPIHSWITMIAVVISIALCWRIWGAPLALFGIALIGYYFFGQYTPWIFNIIPMSFHEQFPEDIWFNLSKGALGDLVEVTIFTVLPFIVFGAMLEATGVGGSLVRFAFRATRNTRGGPAHAAVLASSLFGTMSGVPVANVVGH